MRPLFAPLLVAAAMALVPPAAGAQPTRGAAMVRIPPGTYVPLYAADGQRQAVAAFSLDRHPVTRAEYSAFLRRQPKWRSGAAAPDGAGTTQQQASAVTETSASEDGRRPATRMTWHAANAYCTERGARLPTLAEWEYVAAASETRRDAARDPAFMQRLLATYSTRPRPLPSVDRAARNAYGVRGMHDLAWEWVDDNGQTADHEHHGSHAAHGAWCASAAIGAADPGNYPAFLRFAVRSRLTPGSALEMLGFRCAA